MVTFMFQAGDWNSDSDKMKSRELSEVSDIDWYRDAMEGSMRAARMLSMVAVNSKRREEYRERAQRCGRILRRLADDKVSCDFCEDECEVSGLYKDYVVWQDDETIVCSECLRGRLLYVDKDTKQWKMEAANMAAPIPFPFSLLKIFTSFALWIRRIERCPICGHRVDTWIMNRPLETVDFNNRTYHRYCFIQELKGSFSTLDYLIDEWSNPRTFFIRKGKVRVRVRPGLRIHDLDGVQ